MASRSATLYVVWHCEGVWQIPFFTVFCACLARVLRVFCACFAGNFFKNGFAPDLNKISGKHVLNILREFRVSVKEISAKHAQNIL